MHWHLTCVICVLNQCLLVSIFVSLQRPSQIFARSCMIVWATKRVSKAWRYFLQDTDVFQERLKDYVQKPLIKGIPSLFSDLKGLYWWVRLTLHHLSWNSFDRIFKETFCLTQKTKCACVKNEDRKWHGKYPEILMHAFSILSSNYLFLGLFYSWIYSWLNVSCSDTLLVYQCNTHFLNFECCCIKQDFRQRLFADLLLSILFWLFKGLRRKPKSLALFLRSFYLIASLENYSQICPQLVKLLCGSKYF